MSLSRRTLVKRTLAAAGTLAFADILGVERVAAKLGSDGERTILMTLPVYRTQFDGNYCCCCNCGAASAAMLRSAQSNQAYNPTAGAMRIWYNYVWYGSQCGSSSYYCSCKTGGGSCGSQNCPDTGTYLSGLYSALMNPRDGGPAYPNTYLRDGISWSTFANALDPNVYPNPYSAVLNGLNSYNPKRQMCGSSYLLGHSVYVALYSPSSNAYKVYDPDNNNGCSQPKWWTPSELQAFATHFLSDGLVHCILGK